MLTYPKSTKRVRCIPMHLSLGHVTFMLGKFSPPLYPTSISPNRTQGDGRTHVGLCPKFLVFLYFLCYHFLIWTALSVFLLCSCMILEYMITYYLLLFAVLLCMLSSEDYQNYHYVNYICMHIMEFLQFQVFMFCVSVKVKLSVSVL